MKKIYSKPGIVFESFALSQSIAGDCEVKTNTPARMQCAYGQEEFGVALFLDTVNSCVSKVQENDGDSFCYHVPAANNNLFNS